jgi:hypothetical protein
VLRKSPKPSASSWAPVVNASAVDGAYVVSDVAGASASLSFTGTGAVLLTATGPQFGRAEVYVDGVLVRTIDLYSAVPAFGASRTVAGFTDTSHVVTVVVLGEHRAAATGSSILVDGWIVK